MSSEPVPSDAFLRALEAFQSSMSKNHVEQAEAAAVDLLNLAAQEMQRNPTPGFAVRQEAGQCEARGDWAGAEAAYRTVLAMPETAAAPGLISKAHHDLSRLLLLTGDLDNADRCACAATEAARDSGLFPLAVMALETEAHCALRRSETTRALQLAEEAVARVEPGPANDFMRAGAWVLRAGCRLSAGDVAGAEQDLAVSRPILLEHELSPIFAGAHAKAAHWLEVRALLCAQRGELRSSAEAWAMAVDRRRHINSLPHVSGPHTMAALARSLQRLAAALTAAGDAADGNQASIEAQQIWDELGLPTQGRPGVT